MLKYFSFLIAAFFFITACNEAPKEEVTTLESLQAKVGELNNLNADLDKQRNELHSLIRTFNSERPENEQFDITASDTLMGAPERELLKAMFKGEENITYNGLLSKIIEKNNLISELNEKITTLENQLPKPYDVQVGDTHYEIIRNYLVSQQGMDLKKAREIAFKTNMTDNILPGNKIWMLYNETDGIVGTYVTQGNAKINPMQFEQIAKKRMIEKAVKEAVEKSKTEQVSSLEKTDTYVSTKN